MPKRVKLEFDETSRVSLDRLREQGAILPPWPPVLFAPPGYGGDWSKAPLGEILDGNKMQESGFAAKCLKYNCHCGMDHS